jgi:glucose/arabinose dehydrogenase
MRNWIIGIALVAIVGVAACSALLPEGMVIKGPILSSMFGRGIDAPSSSTVQSRFHLAEGFEVQLFAEGIPNARFMRFSPGGDLIVSQPRAGQLTHVFRDLDGDGRSDGHKVLIENLDRPHGFDFHDQHLYIGEGGAIARVGFLETGPDSIAVAGEPTRIVEGIPEGENHWSRTLRFGPDDKIYLQVGSSCNVCEEEDPRRAAILRFNVDGSGAEIFASGLRNSVGFDWRPGTDELYATDNGRDLLGDDYPPCELNRIERGGFYGFPVANGNRRPDPDFGEGQADRIEASIPPAHSFQAHTAPLGMTFVRHPQAQESMRGAALVALHGSWNRSELSGYKVVSLHWDANGEIEERDFMTGFNLDDDIIGRPVDIIEGPDGSFYLSDDYAGAIYRIAPTGTLAGASNTQLNTQLSRPASAPITDPLAELDAVTLAELASLGAGLFVGNACGSCHIAGLAKAGVVVKPLGGLAAKYTIDSLSRFFLTPQPPMPVIALPEDDRRALAIYMLSTYAN